MLAESAVCEQLPCYYLGSSSSCGEGSSAARLHMEERGKKEGLGGSRGQGGEKRGKGKRGERGEVEGGRGEGDEVHQQSRSEETPNERADKEANGKCI